MPSDQVAAQLDRHQNITAAISACTEALANVNRVRHPSPHLATLRHHLALGVNRLAALQRAATPSDKPPTRPVRKPPRSKSNRQPRGKRGGQ